MDNSSTNVSSKLHEQANSNSNAGLVRQSSTIERSSKKKRNRRLLLQIMLCALAILLLLIGVDRLNSKVSSTQNHGLKNHQLAKLIRNNAQNKSTADLEIHKNKLRDLRMHNILRDVSSDIQSLVNNSEKPFQAGPDSATRNHANSSHQYKLVVEEWESAFVHGDPLP